MTDLSSFSFDKLVILAVAPLGSALLVGLLALLLATTRRKRWAWWLALAAVLWLWLWSTPVVSNWARSTLERQYPPVAVDSLPQAQALVVLGGAISPPQAQQPLPNLHAAADRLWHAARIWRAGKAPLVLLSGGGPGNPAAVPEAQAMRMFLQDLGVPEQAMLLEEHSGNTRQNAAMSAALLKQRGITRVLLVTSALHMPRAKALFESVGLQVVPAATDHETLGQLDPWRYLPSAEALDGSGRALKEWVAKWTGR